MLGADLPRRIMIAIVQCFQCDTYLQPVGLGRSLCCVLKSGIHYLSWLCDSRSPIVQAHIFSFCLPHILTAQAPNLDSLYGYLTSSSFRYHNCFFFLVGTCSTQTCFARSFMNFRTNRGSQSSLATPKSLQHRIMALDLHPSVAVGMPSGEK